MSKFNQKKTEEQAVKDSQARQQALEKLGITQEFNHLDHAKIYSYADHAVSAPIESVDASFPPPEITQYPERSPCPSPRPDPTSSKLERIDRLAEADSRKLLAAESAQHAAGLHAKRMRRAIAIMQSTIGRRK